MVQAYSASFPEPRFTVWSRTRNTAEAMGLPVADDLEAAVRQADMICTATMATEPLIKGDWLQPGQHLDLIGAYTPAMREVDDTAMARARVFVDARATTIHHIGEIMDPIASGAITEGDMIADFYDDPAHFHPPLGRRDHHRQERRRRASGPDDRKLHRKSLGQPRLSGSHLTRTRVIGFTRYQISLPISSAVSTLPVDRSFSSTTSPGVDITPYAAISAKSVTLTISASLPAAAAAAFAFSPRATHFLQPEPGS